MNYRYRAAIAAAILLGVVVRVMPVIGTDFPLGDGGLFVAMAERIRQDGFGLPATVQYNGRELPFTYPPLGLYLTAISPFSILDTMVVLPVLLSCLLLVAVAALARALLRDDARTVAAVAAFAAMPLAYRYFILAAGVTRALGALLAVLTLLFLYRAIHLRSTRDVVLAGLCGAGTLLSHPNATWFALVSAGVFVALLVRDRDAWQRVLAMGVITLAVSSFWWIPAIARHGITPFLFAAQSGNPTSPGWSTLLGLRFTGEQIPVLALAAVAGIVTGLAEGQILVASWFSVACATDIRYECTFASAPAALLVGIVAWPFLVRARCEMRALRAGTTVSLKRAWPTLLFAAAIAYAVSLPFVVRDPTLTSLSSDQRTAMAWIAGHVDQGAQFVVIAPAGPGAGSESEWFPVLGRHASVATYQGTEWTGSTQPSGWELYERLQRCGLASDPDCLDRWSSDAGVSFSHVFLRTDYTENFAAALRGSSRYRVIYENSGALVFERVGATASAEPLTTSR